MTHSQPFFYIARLVLETSTPLSIATGRTDGIADNLLVRDANGLPAIPGSSLAGVLRHAYQRHYGKKLTIALFGSDKNQDTDNNPSCVHCSWGCLHGNNDQPIEGLLDPDDERFTTDKIVKDALQTTPIQRDHVKLTHRGTSDTKNQGKFDRTSLTTGHRFTIELSLWSKEKNDPRWQQLLNLLKRPDFRLGGGTRRGLGKLKIVRGYTGEFNLKNPKEFEFFSQLPQEFAKTTEYFETVQSEEYFKEHNIFREFGNHETISETTVNSDSFSQKISLALTPLDGYGYRFGGGIEPLFDKQNETDNPPANLLAVTEHCVTWKTGPGCLTKQKQIVIPASSVKGAISHRVAYYYNILTGQFADDIAIDDYQKYVGENNEAVKALFGYVKEKQNETDKDIAQIGCLIFDDMYLDRNRVAKNNQKSLYPVEYTHNSVDRFTGGVREGALFSEEVLTDTQSFKLDITVALSQDEKKSLSPKIWKALQLTLNDLAEGRLALGAGGGRGHGYFNGQWLASCIPPDNIQS